MKQYEILPHTADVAIRATGSTKPALLAAALQGMFAAAEPRFLTPEEPRQRVFKIEAGDFAALLVDFLNQAVALSDINREAYEDARFSLVTDKKIEGTLIGRAIDSFGTQIKAATHHNLEVKKNGQDFWEATITFDV